MNKEKLKHLLQELKNIFATKKELEKIIEVVDEPPVYVKPEIYLSADPMIIPHNEVTTVVFTPGFKQNDAGKISRVLLKRENKVVLETTDLQKFTDYISYSHNGAVVYKLTINYHEGEVKSSALGIAYPDDNIKAGSLTTNITINAYAPSYYGVIDNDYVDEDIISNLNKVLNATNGYTINVSMKNQRSVFMYPSSFGTLSSIKDANNFEYINSYTMSTIEYKGVNYYVYILTDPVTITDFKQMFS